MRRSKRRERSKPRFKITPKPRPRPRPSKLSKTRLRPTNWRPAGPPPAPKRSRLPRSRPPPPPRRSPKPRKSRPDARPRRRLSLRLPPPGRLLPSPLNRLLPSSQHPSRLLRCHRVGPGHHLHLPVALRLVHRDGQIDLLQYRGEGFGPVWRFCEKVERQRPFARMGLA